MTVHHRFLVASLLAALAACTPARTTDGASSSSTSSSGATSTLRPDGGGMPTGSSGAAGSTSSSGAPSSSASLDCSDIQAGDAPVRLLTRAEYNHTIRDLLGDSSRPADGFPRENQALGFDNNAEAHMASTLLVEKMQATAEELANRYVGTRLASEFPCVATVNAAPGDASVASSCAQTFVRTLGMRAYRRPLEDDEVTILMDVFHAAAAHPQASFSTRIAQVVAVILQSPQFLYRIHALQPAESGGGITAIPPFELASRLSYFLWATMPDDLLLDAASTGALNTLGGVETQVRRMLADAKAKDAVHEFHRQWLKLEGLRDVERTLPPGAPAIEVLRTSWATSIQRMVEHAVFGGGGLDELLTTPTLEIDDALAQLYGIPASGSSGGWRPLDFTGERAGILTHPALMALLSHSDQTSPIHRGIFVREQLMCEPLPAPPNDVAIIPPDPDPNATTRERFRQHSLDDSCVGCHTLIDPIGFGFENYDHTGAFRTTENGLPIDSSGAIMLPRDFALEGEFQGGVGLAQRLRGQRQVSNCFSEQYYRFAMGRGAAGPRDQCNLLRAQDGFAAEQGNVQELLVALATSEAFRYRPTVTPTQPPALMDPDAGVPTMDAGQPPAPDAGTGTPDAGVYAEPNPTAPIGFLDAVSADGVVYGWTLDPNAPLYALEIQVFIDGTYTYPAYRADLPRPDVNTVTGWPGQHGFVFRLPPQLFDGTSHSLAVWAVDVGDSIVGNFQLNGSPKTFSLPANVARGYLDVVHASGVAQGWAYDPDTPVTNILVRFYMDAPYFLGGTLVGEGATGGSRPDVNAAFNLGPEPMTGFSVQLSAAVRDGQMHTLYGYAVDATSGGVLGDLGGTPTTVQVNP